MSLYEEIVNKEVKISLIGLGYVGMPIAVEFAKKVDVIGFDVNNIDNYEKSTIDKSFIEYGKIYKKEAERIKAELGISKLIEKDDETNIRVIIGKDLDI